jgi:U3 small nucleolar RNA-associated protein 14
MVKIKEMRTKKLKVGFIFVYQTTIKQVSLIQALNFSCNEISGHENREERLRKLKAITAEETKGEENGRQDEEENTLDDSDQDETFELMNEDEAGEKKGKKTKGKVKDVKKGKEKRKKLKRRISKGNEEEEDVVEEKELEGNGAKRGKKRKGKSKAVLEENTEETSDVEKTTRVKKIKRKIKEESRMKEKSKKSKKAKLVKSGLDGDIGDETVQDKAFENDHDGQLLIEGDGVDDGEVSQAQMLDLEAADAAEDVPEESTLNPKNVFQIEDLGGENDLLNYTVDNDETQRMTIQEAFANDDVVEEFVKEKNETTEASKAKDLDTSLPGWGDWGGPGIDETKRRKKFTVPAKPGPPRKDSKLAHVIINEDRDKKFAKNQVTCWSVGTMHCFREHWLYCLRTIALLSWNNASIVLEQ